MSASRFLARLPVREEARVLGIFEQMARHPMLLSGDIPRTDKKGRQEWLRFTDGFAVVFWIDHAEKEVRVSDVGFE